MKIKRPALFSQIKKQYQTRSQARRENIGKANDALSKSKRAIFALHRNDPAGAAKLIKEAVQLFVVCEKKFIKFPNLIHEGAYRAALEEYAEALLFDQYLKKGSIGKIDKRAMAPDIYLAGLSDTTGEIVRYAIREVTSGNFDQVKKAKAAVEMIIEFLLDLDLTGYQRTKFDQAKKNLRRLEEIIYDISIRSTASMDFSSR